MGGYRKGMSMAKGKTKNIRPTRKQAKATAKRNLTTRAVSKAVNLKKYK